MSVYEGCATICNNKGRLLFYSDGENLWDSSHQITPNGFGLKGGLNATQAVLIVPKPGIKNQYYLFTVEGMRAAAGLMYSEIDISLNSGKGDIIPGKKNIQLTTPISEKLTCVKHQNGIDLWVVVMKINSDSIFSYLVQGSKINSIPVKSVTGVKNNGSISGEVKISPNGKKIAFANTYASNFIGDFDNATGKVINLWFFSGQSMAYGIEFSKNSHKLYVSSGFNSQKIIQYNVLANSELSFGKSAITIMSTAIQLGYGSLQRGPNGKIYAAVVGAPFLDVINEPDSIGLRCRPQQNAVKLGNICQYGLPNNSPTYFTIESKGYCPGDTIYFNISGPSNSIDANSWCFADPASGPSNFSQKTTGTYHIYHRPGNYRISCAYSNSGIIDTIFTDLKIITPKKPKLGNDTVLCTGQTITIKPQTAFKNLLWNNQLIGDTLKITHAGIYTVKAIDSSGCNSYDSIKIDYFPLPVVNFNNQYYLCEENKETIKLDAGKFKFYHWYPTHDTTRYYIVSKNGSYYVIIQDNFGCTNSAGTQVKNDCKRNIYIPNSFSPNNDGINDYWTIDGKESILEVFIINRWGEMVHSSSGSSIQWDGMYRGEIIQDGPLVYWIYISNPQNHESSFVKGTLQILK